MGRYSGAHRQLPEASQGQCTTRNCQAHPQRKNGEDSGRRMGRQIHQWTEQKDGVPDHSGANYMDIKSLLHLGCAKIATLIKGKSPEEIKKILSEDDGDDEKENKEA